MPSYSHKKQALQDLISWANEQFDDCDDEGPKDSPDLAKAEAYGIQKAYDLAIPMIQQLESELNQMRFTLEAERNRKEKAISILKQ